MTFNYSFFNKFSRPPSGRPYPPFGATTIEVMRSCPLRSCFDFSTGYVRRMGVAARIGTAMHRTIQSFTDNSLRDNRSEAVAAEATRRFLMELEVQKVQAIENPREYRLPWDTVRIERAMEAVIVEALRINGNLTEPISNDLLSTSKISKAVHYLNPQDCRKSIIELPACEVPVQSKDNLFRGRIDRVESIPEGVRLIDYKSAYRDELPDRYTRQIQLYAYLWNETTGDWPAEAQIFYPLKGKFYQVPIDEVSCLKVIAEYRTLIHNISNYNNPTEIALPGDTCKICDYRPWCQSFWNWLASEKILIKAKEKAAIGFEGKLESLRLEEHYWRLIISWRNIEIRLIVPQERFPHLINGKTGQFIRVLDAPLRGALSQPSVQVLETTEVFLIV